MRQRCIGAAAAVSLLVACVAAPALAQSRAGGFGIHGGGLYVSELTPGTATEAMLDPVWSAGIQLERWFGTGRLGMRLNATYAEPGEELSGLDLNTYAGDVSLLLRPLPARRGRIVAPFISLGGGMLHYNPGDAAPTFLAGGVIPTNASNVLTAVGGVGFDIMPSSRINLRIDAADHVALESPFEDPVSGTPFGVVHNVRVTAGLHLNFGTLGVAGEPVLAFGEEDTPEPPPAGDPGEEPPPEPQPEAQRPDPADPGEGPEYALRSEVERLRQRIAELESRNRDVSALRERLAELEEGGAAAPVAQPQPSVESSACGMGSLYTLQVGAFEERGDADAIASEARGRGLPVRVTTATVGGTLYHRVRVGASTRPSDIQRLSDWIQNEFQWAVWLAPVASCRDVPADTVAATRDFLRGS